MAAAIASTRGDRPPARSPNASRWMSLTWAIRPASSSFAEMKHDPPSTRPGPNRASSASRCRMPLSSGTTAVSGPTAGAKDSIAPSRSYALHDRITTSNGSRRSAARTVGGDGG